ncbi:hypothetical protein [Kutzneria sp. NPDC051319]|uniref:hypothetical protein n=1 Tax=Kutzneria sp. NPDC051319 TaxID=3155047 RepID=UPI0034325CCC
MRRVVLLVAEMAQAALRAFIEQGDGTVPIWAAVPAMRVLAVIIRWSRNGK